MATRGESFPIMVRKEAIYPKKYSINSHISLKMVGAMLYPTFYI